MTPFERIHTHAINKCHRLSMCMATMPIHSWIEQGYDLEKDIIPAIDFATKSGSSHIRYFSFFDGAIKSFHAKRIAQSAKPKEYTKEEKDAFQAKALAFSIRKMGRNLPTDERWLIAYEQKHGRVEI